MNILFAGTPAFALQPLLALAAAGWRPSAVLTQPDKPQGRKGVLTPSPVKEAALGLGIPVLQPARVRDETAMLASLGADCMITCAYGQILTQEVLDLFPKGVWNIHASLLPAYRGAAPIARAILAGERETGITIMKTELGIDTGGILLARPLAISPEDTCGTLTERLSRLGAEAILQALPSICAGDAPLTPQGEGFVCKKVQRTPVDFTCPAAEVCRLVRALSPAPLAYAASGGLLLNLYFACEAEGREGALPGTVLCADPKRGLIVQCGEGAVRLSEVQPAGGRRMRDREFLNGKKLAEGARFDQPVL